MSTVMLVMSLGLRGHGHDLQRVAKGRTGLKNTRPYKLTVVSMLRTACCVCISHPAMPVLEAMPARMASQLKDHVHVQRRGSFRGTGARLNHRPVAATCMRKKGNKNSTGTRLDDGAVAATCMRQKGRSKTHSNATR